MSRGSLQRLSAERLQEADGASSNRFVDLRVDLRAENTEELILAAGGRWDRERGAMVGPGETARVLYLHAGQLDAGRWFARWLAGYLRGEHDPDCRRVWSVLFAGGRRGGKSDIGVKCSAAFLVAVLMSYVWAVSPAQEETEELKDVLDGIFPDDWALGGQKLYLGEPHWCYQIANGSRLWLRSGFKPATLKRGRVDLVLLNEAQRMSQRAFAMVRGATSDTGGLTIAAANPPDEPIGQWIDDFYVEAKAGKRHARVFDFDPENNPHVVHESLEDLRADVDDLTFRREVKGEFGLPMGDRVLHNWSPKLNVQPTPTCPSCSSRFLSRYFPGRGFEAAVGLDFQLSPYMAAVVYQAFPDPTLDDPDTGEPLLWVPGGGGIAVEGDENDLVDALEAFGLDPKGTALIGDASGEWQDAERTKGRGSFDLIRRRGWRNLYMPDPIAKKNPLISERCAVCRARICTADQKRHVFSDPANATLNVALNRWELKNGVPYRRSKYAHLCDAFGYPLWRFYPRKAGQGVRMEYTGLGSYRRRSELAMTDDDDED